MSLRRLREQLGVLREETSEVAAERASTALNELVASLRRIYECQKADPDRKPASLMQKLVSFNEVDIEQSLVAAAERMGENAAMGLRAVETREQIIETQGDSFKRAYLKRGRPLRGARSSTTS